MGPEIEQADRRRRAVIFESYGWGDAADIAKRIKASLEEAEYEVWIDSEHIRPDDKDFPVLLERALDNCRLVVALLSPHSVRLDHDVPTARRMSVCHAELIRAVDKAVPVIPVTVIDCHPPLAINKYDPIPFTNWQISSDAYSAGIQELLRWIDEGLGDPPRLRYRIYVDNLPGARLSFPEESTAELDFVGRGWLMDGLAAWLERGGGKCFLIEAEPGSGKTALVAELVRRNHQDRILAYHFCDSQRKDAVDPRRFVRSLAAMLCGTVAAYRERLRTSVDLISKLKIDNDPKTMLWEGVLAPLRLLPMEGTRYIVVDALDEAAGSPGISVPRLLSDAVDHFPPWLKLVATTRRDDRVPGYRSATRYFLAHSQAEQRDDLRHYIERRFTEPKLRALSPDEGARRRAVAAFAERSAGNFRYAAMVLDELSSGALLVAEVDRLPNSLADLYENRAAARFAVPSDFATPRRVLGVLLAARQPLTLDRLAMITGLDRSGQLSETLAQMSCFITWDGGLDDARFYRLADKSIADWLTASPGGSDRFRVDPAQGRELILAHCRKWETHHESYALTYLIDHLLEGDLRGEALTVVRDGFFAKRRAWVDPRYDFPRCDFPRCDFDDTRSLTLALVESKDQPAILELAQTDNLGQRDGVAAGLQAAPPDSDDFVDLVVGALFRVS